MLSACLTKTNNCIPYVSNINLHNRKRGESLESSTGENWFYQTS
mgnify:FL=1